MRSHRRYVAIAHSGTVLCHTLLLWVTHFTVRCWMLGRQQHQGHLGMSTAHATRYNALNDADTLPAAVVDCVHMIGVIVAWNHLDAWITLLLVHFTKLSLCKHLTLVAIVSIQLVMLNT